MLSTIKRSLGIAWINLGWDANHIFKHFGLCIIVRKLCTFAGFATSWWVHKLDSTRRSCHHGYSIPSPPGETEYQPWRTFREHKAQEDQGGEEQEVRTGKDTNHIGYYCGCHGGGHLDLSPHWQPSQFVPRCKPLGGTRHRRTRGERNRRSGQVRAPII